MLRVGAIVLNVTDLVAARRFWGEALGYQPGANPDFLHPPGGVGQPCVHLDETDRTHVDLWVDSAAEQRAEVARLEALGATRPDWDHPDGADFVVLADPDGTLFCVVNTGAG